MSTRLRRSSVLQAVSGTPRTVVGACSDVDRFRDCAFSLLYLARPRLVQNIIAGWLILMGFEATLNGVLQLVLRHLNPAADALLPVPVALWYAALVAGPTLMIAVVRLLMIRRRHDQVHSKPVIQPHRLMTSGSTGTGRPGRLDQTRSNRSSSITLTHAATKSFTNFSFASSVA